MSDEPHYRVFYNELSFLSQRKKTKTQLYYLPASAFLWKAKCEFTLQNCAFVQNLNWIFLMHTELLEELLDSTCIRQLSDSPAKSLQLLRLLKNICTKSEVI